ncbi:flagellin [Halosolutus amylolyticus]|uniref:Flagellin n=1 Tax=Halosolutus amylolyticus TaxID=2932267 RepID=A0ABD5PPM3_9EURY|nr:flagellin [Halosolutus amylolyticus]
MVRTAVVHLLLFIAAVSVATLGAGVIVTETSEYAQSVDGEADRTVAEIDAEIAIVSDPAAGATYDEANGTVTLYVRNVGGDALEPGDAEVLVDGEYVAAPSTRVLDAEHDRWRVGSLLEVTAGATLGPGEHRGLVSIDGARDHLTFEHRIARWLSPAGQDGTSDDCTADQCTVYLDETTELVLEMETEGPQPGEEVTYASSNESVATVDPETGVTAQDGTDEITLSLDETGETTVTLDAGWDDDAIDIGVEETRN